MFTLFKNVPNRGAATLTETAFYSMRMKNLIVSHILCDVRRPSGPTIFDEGVGK